MADHMTKLSTIHYLLLLTYGWYFSYEDPPQSIGHAATNVTYKTLLFEG